MRDSPRLAFSLAYVWHLTADKIALLAPSGLLRVALASVMLRLAGLLPDNGRHGLAAILFVFTTVVAMAVITASIRAASIVADVTDQIRLKTGRQPDGSTFRQ